MKTRVFFGIIAIVLAAGLCGACGSGPKANGPDLTGVTSYYVRADGNNRNTGISEDSPFKTLQRAVEAASGTSVKTITVIGTLVGSTTIKSARPPALSTELDFVIRQIGNVTMVDTTQPATFKLTGSYDDHDPNEILITGKPGASGTEKAVLTDTSNTDNILLIESASVRLENIEISGFNSTNPRSRCIRVSEGVLTLGQGAKITGNTGIVGILAFNQSVVIMRNDAEVSNNQGNSNVGVYLETGSVMVMLDNAAIRGNRATIENAGGGAGVALAAPATLIMQDNSSIADNSAEKASGGGIATFPSEDGRLIGLIKMSGNAKITGNTAANGGGILLQVKLVMEDTAQITGNSATGICGGVYGEGNQASVSVAPTAVLVNNTAPEFPNTNFRGFD